MKAVRLFVPLFVFLLTACGDLLDPAAAVVGDDKITVDQITAIVEDYEDTAEFKQVATQGEPQEILRQFEQSRLSQLIRRAVLQPQADELDIEVTDEEVAQRLDQIKGDFPSEEAFQDALAEQGLTADYLNELIYDSLLEEELRAKVTEGAGPADEELLDFYQENLNDYRQTRAQHILLESRRLAASLATRLRAARGGEIEGLFARLAERYSTDPSNSGKGGDLGYFSVGQFAPPFEQTAADLSIGEISAPVRTQFGFHVIRVTDRRVAPFEQVRGQIEEVLGGEAEDEAWQEWVVDAYEDADIRVNPRYGELDLDTQQIVNPSAQDVPGADESQATPTPEPTAAPTP
ncbi:MAG: peptidylprolyl isomerase [Actinomycetota bacterium]